MPELDEVLQCLNRVLNRCYSFQESDSQGLLLSIEQDIKHTFMHIEDNHIILEETNAIKELYTTGQAWNTEASND